MAGILTTGYWDWEEYTSEAGREQEETPGAIVSNIINSELDGTTGRNGRRHSAFRTKRQ